MLNREKGGSGCPFFVVCREIAFPERGLSWRLRSGAHRVNALGIVVGLRLG